MVKGGQGVTTKAKNTNAKYKITTTRGQTISGNDQRMYIKYTYSRLLSTLTSRKYSYAV